MASSISIFFITLTLLSTTTPSPTTTTPSVYKVLESFDFPIGLLPEGVTTYQLDNTTGNFIVNLDNDCTFTIQGYQLKYKSKITGTISKDVIKNISGIQVKILFFWLSIVEVVRVDDEIQFSVGIASANFPVDGFYECPQCGCGFDCVNKVKGEIGFKNSVFFSYLFGN
ncbi:hypothetical protein LIER_35234 [Lithospermum erythrorhizon]|uniref:Transmembrane protein n=1 Tax=Lithospermum erythrorhizon TaxID=34254 RepID=A0AAV3NNF0_LITER